MERLATRLADGRGAEGTRASIMHDRGTKIWGHPSSDAARLLSCLITFYQLLCYRHKLIPSLTSGELTRRWREVTGGASYSDGWLVVVSMAVLAVSFPVSVIPWQSILSMTKTG